MARPRGVPGHDPGGRRRLPAQVAALVALDEVVVHGWDLARATGRDYQPPPDDVDRCLAFAVSFEAPADAPDGGPFAPPRPVAASAPALDRLAAATGRDPAWRLTRR